MATTTELQVQITKILETMASLQSKTNALEAGTIVQGLIDELEARCAALEADYNNLLVRIQELETRYLNAQ